MKQVAEHYDVVVCGGGLAGFCAAVASARHGARTCLVHDRSVFGGNSSSEVRVTPHGSAQFHTYARETGIISELLIEERARNHEPVLENGWTNSVWDMVMYDMAVNTPNLTFRVNTTVVAVEMEGVPQRCVGSEPGQHNVRFGFIHRPGCAPSRLIKAVVGRVAGAETEIVVAGKTFIDCTGDGVVADMAGCEWRMGSEGREEFHEPHAPDKPSADTMGNSIHFKAKNMGYPVPFTPPSWAIRHDNGDYFYKQGRVPYTPQGGYWWIEIGMPWHTIYDAENIRHELTRHCLGVWDWIKNKDPVLKQRAANYALDWIGQVPGKRESRRVIGRYFVTEHDILNRIEFPDEVAYGGWFVDLHTPGGLLADKSEPAAAESYRHDSDYAAMSYCGPYGVPLRCLVAKDVDNLMMAGRNISVTHAALGTMRVMGTTALMGQAAGTAAALALRRQLPLDVPPQSLVADIQQALLRDGCFLLHHRNGDPRDLARTALVSASSEARLSGVDPGTEGVHGGLARWGLGGLGEHLAQTRGQWFAVNGPVDTIAVCLSNETATPQRVGAALYRVDNIWDYRLVPGEPLARTDLVVPVGETDWVEWPVNLGSLTAGYLRLDLSSKPAVRWHSCRRLEPGCVAGYQISATKMRGFVDGQSLAYRVVPPQPVFGPFQVVNGVTRPHALPNLWRSDPLAPMPQWLELRWPSPQTIAVVELAFPGHLLREYHAYPPFYRDPQCPKDYVIEGWIQNGWRELIRVHGNYQRHLRHRLDAPVSTDRLRVTVSATNGDPSAGIYEVRCYE